MLKEKREEEQLSKEIQIATGFTSVTVSFSREVYCAGMFDGNFDREIPGGFRLLGLGEKSKYGQIKLRAVDDSLNYLEQNSRTEFTLRSSFDSKSFLRQILYISYNIGELLRQEDYSIVTTHAAAVSTKDGKGILILGDKGSGKTSLALALCLNNDCRLVGNDLVALRDDNGRLQLLGGNTVFNIRKGAQSLYFPQVEQKIQGKTTSNPYELKLRVFPEQLGVGVIDRLVDLSLIVRVNLHNMNGETSIESVLDTEVEILRLRENLARYIRGLTTPINVDDAESSGYFPSLDSVEANRMRNGMIKSLLNTSFRYIYGSNPYTLADSLNALLRQL